MHCCAPACVGRVGVRNVALLWRDDVMLGARCAVPSAHNRYASAGQHVHSHPAFSGVNGFAAALKANGAPEAAATPEMLEAGFSFWTLDIASTDSASSFLLIPAPTLPRAFGESERRM